LRNPLRRRRSALECSAIEEEEEEEGKKEEDVSSEDLNFEVHLSQLSSHCELDSSMFVLRSKKY